MNKQKLKTLKDLQKEYEWKWDTYNALRQEAINWVDFLDKEIFNKELSGLKSMEEKQIGISATREWIVKFFNITK